MQAVTLNNKPPEMCPVVDGISVTHHFAAGVYTKQVLLALGCSITGHKHLHDHLSLLAYGSVIVELHGMQQLYTGPTALNIMADCVHKITAVTPALWYCIHAVDDEVVAAAGAGAGADKIDATLVKWE